MSLSLVDLAADDRVGAMLALALPDRLAVRCNSTGGAARYTLGSGQVRFLSTQPFQARLSLLAGLFLCFSLCRQLCLASPQFLRCGVCRQ